MPDPYSVAATCLNGEDSEVAMHQDQIPVDAGVVARLVADQFPDWGDLSVSQVRSSGTVNAIFRIGPDLAARFPLRFVEPSRCLTDLETEFESAQELAKISTVATPEPVAIGRPGEGYPMPWSVQTWVPGHDATVEDPASSDAFALDLARLIIALRGAPTHGRSFNGQGRGGHLPDHDRWLEKCFRESEDLLDVVRLRSIWADLRNLSEEDQDVMSHRDLTPPNVVVRNGRLVGLLDGGSYGPADPALDMVGAWHLLDAPRRALLRAELNSSQVQWNRGMAWAFQQAMGLVWYYAESNPTMSQWGRRTIDRILAAYDRE